MSHIFISYSRKNIDFAGKIVDDLAKYKLETWIDWKSIPKGEDWENEIYRGIEEADVFLFLISPESIMSEMCNKEIIHARKNNKRIIPIVIYNVEPKLVPHTISKINWIFCREGEDDFESTIKVIYETICTDYEWLKYHTKLQLKALEWEFSNDNSRLLRGKALREAEKLISQNVAKDPLPTDLQHIYLLASRDNEERLRNRILIGLSMGFIFLLMVTIIAVFQWRRAENQSKEALKQKATAQAASTQAIFESKQSRANELATLAYNNLYKNVDLAYLLSIEAFRLQENYQTRNTLLQVLQSAPRLTTFHIRENDFTSISKLAYSPDGKLLAFGTDEGSMGFINTNTNTLDKIAVQHTDWITGLEFSSDGNMLASGSWDESVILWDLSNFSIVQKITANSGNRVESLAISPEGNLLAIGYSDCSIILWDIQERHTVFKLSINLESGCNPDYSWINNVAFDTSGKTLAVSAYDNKTVYFFDVQDGAILHQLVEPFPILKLHFISDDQIEVLNAGGEVSYWSLPTLEKYNFLIDNHLSLFAQNQDIFAYSRCDIISSDGFCESAGLALAYKYMYGGYAYYPMGDLGKNITEMVFSPDGNRLAIGTLDGRIALLDPNISSSIQMYAPCENVELSYDGKYFSCAFQKWDQKNNKYSEYQLDIENLYTKEVKTFLISKPNKIRNGAFSPNSKLIAFTLCHQINNECNLAYIRLIDLEKKQFVEPTLSIKEQDINKLLFSPNSKTLVASSTQYIFVWNMENLVSTPQIINASGVSAFSISPNNKLLITGDDNGLIQIWDLVTGELIENQSFDLHTRRITSLALQEDGKILISVSEDQRLIIWDFLNSKVLSIIKFPSNAYKALISPNAKRLVYINKNDTISYWNIAPYELIGELDLSLIGTNSLDSTSISFSYSGDKLLTSYLIWNLDSDSWINQACETTGRNFTKVEWLYYFPNDDYHKTCAQFPEGK